MTSPGARLKREREKLHLNQEQLADEIRVTRIAISKLENDKSVPNFKTLQALLMAGVDIFYVLTGVYAPPEYLSKARRSLSENNDTIPDEQELLIQLKSIVQRIEGKND